MIDPRILVLDTETTGFASTSRALADPAQPHIVQLAALQYNPETSRVEQSMCLVVRPEGWEISEKLTEIHGISQQYATDNGQPEADVLRTFFHLWTGAGAPLPLVGHNIKFDLSILTIAFARFFPQVLPEIQAVQTFCTQQTAKDIVQAQAKNGKLKLPTLAETYKHFFDEDLTDAHSANGDTIACLKVYLALKSLL